MPGRNRNGELGSPLSITPLRLPPFGSSIMRHPSPWSAAARAGFRNASPLQVLIVQQPKHGIVASGANGSNLTFGTPPDGSDDLVGIGGPAEGLGDVVALCDKALDHRLEIEERSERGVCDEYGGRTDAHPIFVYPWRRAVANCRECLCRAERGCRRCNSE